MGHLLAVTDYELEFGNVSIGSNNINFLDNFLKVLKNQEKELALKKPKEKPEFSILLKVKSDLN